MALSVCHLFTLDEVNPRSLNRPLTGYHFERGTPALLDELVLCQGPRPDTPRSTFEMFFDAGAQCYVSRHDGQVIGYFWAFLEYYRLRFDSYPRHALTFRLKAGDVFFGNGFIAPPHRLRGVFPRFVDFVASHYPGTRRFSSVNHTNLTSLQAHHRLGFLQKATIACADVATVRIFYRQAETQIPRTLLGIGPTMIDIDDCLREKDRAQSSAVPAKQFHGKTR